MGLRLVSVLFGVFCLLSALPVKAQTDSRAMLDRVERMERDMSILQRQLYRGGGPSPTTGATGGPSGAVPVLEGNAASMLNGRIDQLEEQIRLLTGQLEESRHAQTILNGRFDKLTKDVEIRFNELEQKARPAQMMEAPTSGAGGNENITLVPPKGGAGEASSSSAATPQEKYDNAFALVRQGDYDAAEKAFQSFLSQHGKDNLAGNAHYWLGKTYFVRGDFQRAAVAFAEGFQKFPKGAKAADTLLDLGMSLSSLNQKNDACTTFAKMLKEFPSASDVAKNRAKAERQKLACK